MGHTATLWQGDKLLVYGGENEQRTFLSDLIILDLNTHAWMQPEIRGPIPPGRARHSAVIDDDKLWITGGMSGTPESYVLDDICFLDLRTMTWSRTWKFVTRYDHSSWVWNGRLWVFGGMNHDMERNSEIWWLDIRDPVLYEMDLPYGFTDASTRHSRAGPLSSSSSGGHRIRFGDAGSSRRSAWAPGSVASLKFMSSPNIPFQTLGKHFHVYSSGCLLDFNTPAGISGPSEIGLATLDLETLQWHKLADAGEMFQVDYRWHYCALNQDGTQAWLLGCPTEPNNPADEYLSEFLHIDIRKFGLPGNNLSTNATYSPWHNLANDTSLHTHQPAIGADLARCFDQSPETGSGADFVITAEPEISDGMSDVTASNSSPTVDKPEIHVHKLILQARWPHFARLYAAKMSEYHTNRMHIPEPYSAVRAFLLFLYTDSIGPSTRVGPLRSPSEGPAASLANSNSPRMALTNTPNRKLPPCPTLNEVAGMLVLASCYDMPRLRALCVHRLSRQMNVDQAAMIWDRASEAGEVWLRKRAASFCMMHWGRVIRSKSFDRLDKSQIIELCCEADSSSRVVGADDLEQIRDAMVSHPAKNNNVVYGGGALHYRRVNVVPEAETDEDDDMDTEV